MAKPPAVVCPRCGEDRLIVVTERGYDCAVCAHSWRAGVVQPQRGL